MKLMLEQPISDEDLENIKAQLGYSVEMVRMRRERVTIIHVGPCWVGLEDGKLKVECES